MKTDNKLIGAGLLTAIAASLCCITRALAAMGAGQANLSFKTKPGSGQGLTWSLS